MGKTYERWIDVSNKKLERATLKARRNECNRFAEWARVEYPAIKTAEQLTRASVMAFALHLAESGLSGKTRRNILADLGTVWECLRMERDGIENFWNLIRVDTDSERGKPFSRDQENAILDAAKVIGFDWYEASMVARHTGLRYSDIAHIRADAVDLDRGVIRIRPNKTKRFQIGL